MNTIESLEKMSYLNGYLTGISEFCHGLNYVPLHKIIPCLVLSNDVFADIQKQISLSPATMDACKKCDDFEIVDDWEECLKISLNRWISSLVFSRNIIEESMYVKLKAGSEHKVIYAVKNILDGDEFKVWKFQIGKGCCYTYGFDNEAYAFKSESKLFVINFGWAD